MKENIVDKSKDSLILDLNQVDRVTGLKAWLAYHGIEHVELARELDVPPSSISRVVRGERATPRLIEGMIRLGIPAALLPEPGRTPGRPPKDSGDQE